MKNKIISIFIILLLFSQLNLTKASNLKKINHEEYIDKLLLVQWKDDAGNQLKEKRDMPRFAYQAITDSGKNTSGVIEAESLEAYPK